jgi:hypothetical protein
VTARNLKNVSFPSGVLLYICHFLLILLCFLLLLLLLIVSSAVQCALQKSGVIASAAVSIITISSASRTRSNVRLAFHLTNIFHGLHGSKNPEGVPKW